MSLVGMVGLPNVGKSSLFNELTDSRQRIANFPGITTEKKMGSLKAIKDVQLIDLPGIYTLDVATLDEKVAQDFIFERVKKEAVDLFVLVMDATNLRRSLYLALQLQQINQKFVIALNMMDLSIQRGQKLDLAQLERQFNTSVIPVSATTGEGIELLNQLIENELGQEKGELKLPADFQKKIKATVYVKEQLDQIDEILKKVILEPIKADTFTERLDRFLLHPWIGPIVLCVLLLSMFQLLFSWSDPFMGMIESLFEMAGHFVTTALPDGHLKSLIVDGIIAGVGGIMVFLPHIVFLFLIIYFLEDFGYLGRVAFSLDFLMRKLGLPGKAIVPMLSSHACAIPGIMSARIIKDDQQRMITMLISPLTTCSARLPVYTFIIGVLIPEENLFGLISMQALTLFGLYMLGIVSSFVVAFIMRKTYIRTSPAPLLMELPGYRIPNLKKIIKQSFSKGWMFVKKAGTVILLLSIVIWGLVTFPGAPKGADKPDIHYSYAAKIGKTFEPLFVPLGYDWKLTTALIPSFAAREVLVAAMGTVYAVDGDDVEDTGFLKNLAQVLNSQYPLATLLSLLVWFVYAPQCLSTFAVLKKESGGYRIPMIFLIYTLGLAYGLSFLTYQIFI